MLHRSDTDCFAGAVGLRSGPYALAFLCVEACPWTLSVRREGSTLSHAPAFPRGALPTLFKRFDVTLDQLAAPWSRLMDSAAPRRHCSSPRDTYGGPSGLDDSVQRLGEIPTGAHTRVTARPPPPPRRRHLHLTRNLQWKRTRCGGPTPLRPPSPAGNQPGPQ